MKPEELDWTVYHIIARKGSATPDELAHELQLERDVIEASIARLGSSLLTGVRDGRVHPLSIQESIIMCRLKYSKDLPFSIKDGVITAKAMKKDDEK